MIVYKQVNGETVAYITKEQVEKDIRAKLIDSGIPFEYHGIQFKDLSENISPDISNFANSFSGLGLYLEGANTQGKTSIACCMAKKALIEGKSVYFCLAGDLQDSLMKIEGYNDDDDSRAIVRRASVVDFLVIDDIWDPAKSSLWKDPASKQLQISVWDRFLRKRIGAMRQTVMTSNRPMAEVHSLYGLSIGHLLYRNFKTLTVKAQKDILRDNRYSL